MASVICTLFESHYHYGVATLVNSLYKTGFRGEIFAGYRGTLPSWAQKAEPCVYTEWPQSTTLKVAGDLKLHFLPLDTDYHLTNYKPDFMLRLLDGAAKDAPGIFYFDPDIVITAQWAYFEEWITYGAALSEDVNSPLAENHPRRAAWRKYYLDRGITLNYKENYYVNGGFAGVSTANKSYLEVWKNVQEVMAPAIGGLNRSAFVESQLPAEAQGALAPFGRTDQDAMNIAVEAWDGKASIFGKSAMAFDSGPVVMPHALGRNKPWMGKPLLKALKGRSPRIVDREYWANASHPIRLYPDKTIKWRKLGITVAALIGRVYKKS